LNFKEYKRRLSIAAWAFTPTGIIVPSFTTRPKVNPDRHARVRLKHFSKAVIYIVFDALDYQENLNYDYLITSYLQAQRNCDWGCKY
jgi:hypothetical protein